MKILQYIPPRFSGADYTSEYVSVLTETLAVFAEVERASSLSQFKQKLKDFLPDIIHIHACWNVSGYRAQTMANKAHVPVVLSLHGQMQPWHFHRHYWYRKLSMLLLFQRRAISFADGILALGEMELHRMQQLKWNPRVSMIRNAVTSHLITAQEMASQMLAFYRKVIDSNCFWLMNDEDKMAESRMLHVSLMTKERQAWAIQYAQSFQSTKEVSVLQLSQVSLRRIFIHASDEGILEDVANGARLMQQNTENVVISDIERFAQRLEKNTEPLEGKNILSKNPLTKSTLNNLKQDEKPKDAELRIAIMLLNVQHEMKRQTLSRKHLADLYCELRFSEYDEDILQRMLKGLKIHRLASRLLQIFSETFFLEEGFMPLAPINDNQTAQIRKILLNTNIQ